MHQQEEKEKERAAAEGEAPKKPAESEVVRIFGQIPPIEKMDASLSTLTCCK